MQITVDFEDAAARQMPVPLAIAIARDAAGKYNPITLAWFTRVSLAPPRLAIAIGLERYSLAALRHSQDFVLAIPSTAQQAQTLLYGTVSGRDADKFAQSREALLPAQKIDGVLLADAVVNYECAIESEVTAGDHVLFIATVLAAHVNAEEAAKPLFALPGMRMGGVETA